MEQIEHIPDGSNENRRRELREKLLLVENAIDLYHEEHHGNAEGLGVTEGAKVVSKDLLEFIANADETLALAGNEKKRLFELEQMFLQGKLNDSGKEEALEEFLGYFERYETEKKRNARTGNREPAQ